MASMAEYPSSSFGEGRFQSTSAGTSGASSFVNCKPSDENPTKMPFRKVSSLAATNCKYVVLREKPWGEYIPGIFDALPSRPGLFHAPFKYFVHVPGFPPEATVARATDASHSIGPLGSS